MRNQNTDAREKVVLGRLKKRPEFLAVRATQKKWVSDTVIVEYAPSIGDLKYGVTATKKVGNAVIRNKCKRRLRAAMSDMSHNHILNTANIVLIARHNTATCPWDKLVGDLKWCLKRLEIIQT